MKQSNPNERRAAIHLLRSGCTATEVAEEMGRSLAWVYKWRKRFFEHENWEDLKDRSRAPKSQPRRLAEAMRREIRQARSELEAEAEKPGELLTYISAPAVRARLERKKLKPLPSISSIERVLRQAGMTRPCKPEQQAEVKYPHVQPTEAQQLIQVDIVTHYLRGGPCVACFNALDVVSRYPTGQQFSSRRSVDAMDFHIQVWQELGIPQFTQMDNEACFSGGFTHPAVLGKVLRLCLFVGTEPVFSPVRHPQSNASVERFHQDYNRHVWHKFELPDLGAVRQHSPDFFQAYRHSGHHSALNGRTPAQVHFEQPCARLSADFRLPQRRLPLTAGRVHFMRRVSQEQTISVLNLHWDVPKAQPDQGVWATLEFSQRGAKLLVFDSAPDAPKRTCLAIHPFPLKEPVHPLRPEFRRPIPVEPSRLSLATSLFRSVLKSRIPDWISTML
jgi:transposase